MTKMVEKAVVPLPAQPPDPESFAEVEAWVFDLDNTLYPAHSDLFPQVDRRIRDYVATLLKLGQEEAQKVQKEYYRLYGTTLRGLMTEHDISPDAFLEYVHDIDHSPLVPNPALGAAIERLPGRKLVLTNGSRKHAEAVVRRLGLENAFEDVYDIVAAGFVPKPDPATYDLFVTKHGVDPRRAAMFEDLARNLAVPHALGMRTVLVVPEGTREVFRESWEMEGQDAPHVDHVTDDLTGFLDVLTAAPGAKK